MTTDLETATSDFFVSRASAVDVKPSAVVRIDGIHLLRLALLESVLTDGGIVRAVMWAAKPDIDGGPRGPWITPLSDQLTQALAGLGELDRVHGVVEGWMSAGSWDVRPEVHDELTVGLLLLAHLSREAVRAQRHVWCWTELPASSLKRPNGWGRRVSTRVFRGFVSDQRSGRPK
jgi:hypothetical protein